MLLIVLSGAISGCNTPREEPWSVRHPDVAADLPSVATFMDFYSGNAANPATAGKCSTASRVKVLGEAALAEVERWEDLARSTRHGQAGQQLSGLRVEIREAVSFNTLLLDEGICED